jgi:acetyltransferase-like isoleucine patch superfamily enzyme
MSKGLRMSIELRQEDRVTFAEFGIDLETHPGSHSGVLIIENPEAVRARLKVTFCGAEGRITLRGSHIPRGEIRCLEDNASADITCSNDQTVLDLWLYKHSLFAMKARSVMFGLHAYVYDRTKITIGENCLFSNGISLRTSDHHSIIDLDTLQQLNFPADIIIGDHVWICPDVMVLKGVEIGAGSIIASRALVQKSVPPKELWGGVPARMIKQRVSWVGSEPANPYDVEQMVKLIG